MILRALPVCLLLAAAAHAEQPAITAKDLTWRGAYGAWDVEPHTVYCLLGRSQFGSPVGGDLDRVRDQFLLARPSAVAVPVWSFSPAERKDPDARQVWVWIVDGDANLAFELVLHGCCPASTMAVPDGAEPLVPRQEYEKFVARAKEIEGEARGKRAGIWGNPAALEQEALDRAEALRGEGKHAAAAKAFQEAIAAGADAESCWMSIAECREAMGEYRAALSAYDEAIAKGGSAALGARAHCMSRYEGPSVAAAWLSARIDKADVHADKAFLWTVLGLFHLDEGRAKEAIDPLRRAATMRCDEQALRFDEKDGLVMDEPTSRRRGEDFLVVASALLPLARAALKAGDLDEAFRAATRGVAVMREFRRADGRYAADEVEAGDAAFRSVRGIVLARRGDLDAARREAALAQLLAERGRSSADREAADDAERVIAAEAEKK